MELDELTMDEVPLDFTMKKDNCAVLAAEAESDGLEKFPEDEQLVPLDLSVGRTLLWQMPSSPLPRPQPPYKVYWTPESPSPMMARENFTPLHGMYADDAAYRHMISSPAINKNNPFLPVLPTLVEFPQHNHIQPQLRHLDIQQQQLQQLQLQLDQLQKQMLQAKTTFGGIPQDSVSMLSDSPVYSSSESNHFPLSELDRSFSKPAHGFGYPYYDGMLDDRVAGGVYGGVDTRSNHRADFPPPELTTTCTKITDDHHHQQQQQVDLDRENHFQKLQLQLHHIRAHQIKLQTRATFGGIPLDPASMLGGSPAYGATSSPFSSESNHFPFSGFDRSFSKPAYGFGYPYYDRTLDDRVTGGVYGSVDTRDNHRADCPPPELKTTCTTTTDDHQPQQQQQQGGLDQEHPHRIEKCAKDDMSVADPEEVTAIYRQPEFKWFRYQYMENLEPPRSFENKRWSRNNNSSSSGNNNDNEHRQQQYDQKHMKRQKNNEGAKRSRDAKQQKFVENHISVKHLTKKLSEIKDIKSRLLKDDNDLLAE